MKSLHIRHKHSDSLLNIRRCIDKKTCQKVYYTNWFENQINWYSLIASEYSLKKHKTKLYSLIFQEYTLPKNQTNWYSLNCTCKGLSVKNQTKLYSLKLIKQCEYILLCMWCRVYKGRARRCTTAQVNWGDLSCGGRLGSWYAFELKPTAVLGISSTLSNPAFFKIGKPFFLASSPVHNGFQTCASRPNIVGSVSKVGYTLYPILFFKVFDWFRLLATVRDSFLERHDFDPTKFYENYSWNRRLDGIVINKNHPTLYILKFKRSSDRNEDFLGVKEDEANEQHKLESIIEALKAAAPEWTFKQINFVAQRRGAVVEDDSITSSKGSMYKQGKSTRFWLRMCNAYAKLMTQ